MKNETDLIDLVVGMSLEDVAAGRVYTQEQAKLQRIELAKQLFVNRAEEGIAEIERGEYYTNREVLDRMNKRLERS